MAQKRKRINLATAPVVPIIGPWMETADDDEELWSIGEGANEALYFWVRGCWEPS